MATAPRFIPTGPGTMFPDAPVAAGQPSAPAPTEAPAPAAPAAPARNFRADVRALFPWMSEGMVREYASVWAETGDSALAMAAVRGHRDYDRVWFPGNRRDDGSMRFSEAGYIAQKVGFEETMREFGLRPPASFKGLFEGEVSAGEFEQGLSATAAMLTEPGRRPPTGLLDIYVKSLTSSGSSVDALADLRASSEYRDTFAGIFRDDGSMRMNEQQYFATRQGYRTQLADFGLNPAAFERRHVGLIEGDVSVEELAGRLQAADDNLLDNTEAVQQFYADSYGIDMSRSAILGSFIDPEVGRDVLDRRVAASYVGGEAAMAGFTRSVGRAGELAAAGVTQQAARTLYSQAGRRVPLLQTLVERYNDPGDPFGITDFENALALGDAGVQQRMERRVDDERSAFSRLSDVRQGQEGGLSGLVAR